MRRTRALINPLSTAATGWWCHSSLVRAVRRAGSRASAADVRPWPAREELTEGDRSRVLEDSPVATAGRRLAAAGLIPPVKGAEEAGPDGTTLFIDVIADDMSPDLEAAIATAMKPIPYTLRETAREHGVHYREGRAST